jgi:hypothetical protein
MAGDVRSRNNSLFTKDKTMAATKDLTQADYDELVRIRAENAELTAKLQQRTGKQSSIFFVTGASAKNRGRIQVARGCYLTLGQALRVRDALDDLRSQAQAIKGKVETVSLKNKEGEEYSQVWIGKILAGGVNDKDRVLKFLAGN